MERKNLLWLMPNSGPTGWGNLSSNLAYEVNRHFHLEETPLLMEPMYATVAAIRGVDFKPLYSIPPGNYGKVIGIGFCEFDQTAKLSATRETLQQYNHIICGSQWMKNNVDELIKIHGLSVTTSSHVQGVDQDIFKPIKERGDRESFTVGSFGKYEFRKGQSVVLKAFAEFSKRKSDSYLAVLWHNQWPQTMFNQGPDPYVKSTPMYSKLESQSVHLARLVTQFGIDLERVIIMDQQEDRRQMVWNYQLCDVGLFPNRCEAGSNLCLQEMICCGVPCIATYAHGHMDLEGSFYEIQRIDKKQDSVGNTYYEPCLGDVVVALEKAYHGKLNLDKQRVQEVSKTWTWEALAKHVMEVING